MSEHIQDLLSQAWKFKSQGQVAQVREILELGLLSPLFNHTSSAQKSELYLLQAALKMDQSDFNLASKYIDLAQAEMGKI